MRIEGALAFGLLKLRHMHAHEPATRYLLYCEGQRGLGSFRRALSLAQGLIEDQPKAVVLLVSDSPCVSLYALPPQVDVLKLPSSDSGRRADLASALRRKLLEETFQTFEPHLFVSDGAVLGPGKELVSLLRVAHGKNVRTLLSLSDVLGSRGDLEEEWSDPDVRWALREGYQRVCVLGEPDFFDPRAELGSTSEFLRSIEDRLEWTGYLRARGSRISTSYPPSQASGLVYRGKRS